jgi:hypothetical protein
MPVNVQLLGAVKKVGDIPLGSIVILPTSSGTGIAMVIGTSGAGETRLLFLSDHIGHGKIKRFESVSTAHYSSSAALVIEDCEFLLSSDLAAVEALAGRCSDWCDCV